jgi:hypothetical protein
LPRNASIKDDLSMPQELTIRLAPRLYNPAISCLLKHTYVIGSVMANLILSLLLLCCRYEQLGKTGSAERAEQHRRTLRQALHVWLDQFPEDFCEPPNFPCLSHLGTDQILSSSSPYFCDPFFSVIFYAFSLLFLSAFVFYQCLYFLFFKYKFYVCSYIS